MLALDDLYERALPDLDRPAQLIYLRVIAARLVVDSAPRQMTCMLALFAAATPHQAAILQLTCTRSPAVSLNTQQ
jgi:hypothetical protein